jgi:hypothetical protein
MLNPLPAAEMKELLAGTVPALQKLTEKLSPAEWHYRPGPDQWSVTEILCHLRDVDREVHLPRLQSMIDEEEPFMPGVVADEWAAERNYQAQDGPAALVLLAETRAELLSLLPGAEDPTWQRRGRHTFFGPTSFLELVCLVLEHDELHIAQVQETVASLP